MALKPCSECGRQVSTHAFACPDCGAPVDAASVGARRARTARPVIVKAQGPSTRMFVLVTVTMAVVGVAADAAVRHFRAIPSSAPASQPARTHALAGWFRRLTTRSGGMGALGKDAAGRQAELDMRFDLGEIANREVVDFGAHGSYTKSLDALGVVPRAGVHVTLTAGDGSWSATATHEGLPGVTCRTGAGAGEPRPGQITCDRS